MRWPDFASGHDFLLTISFSCNFLAEDGGAAARAAAKLP
jgi:hypothetical protein